MTPFLAALSNIVVHNVRLPVPLSPYTIMGNPDGGYSKLSLNCLMTPTSDLSLPIICE